MKGYLELKIEFMQEQKEWDENQKRLKQNDEKEDDDESS